MAVRPMQVSMVTHTIEFPAPDLTPYTEGQVRFAVSAWPMRAAEELRSALIFRAIARAATTAGIPSPWPTHFADAMRDEVRHAHLCATVGARLGAHPPQYDSRPVSARLAALPESMMRVCALLLVEVAIGETISMSLFRAGRRTTVEPLTRAALTSILADEVRHQRLGWDAATAIWPLLSEAQRTRLQAEVSAGLAAFEQQNAIPSIRRLEGGEAFDPAYAALGVLAPEARIEAFYSAVEQLVVPRLSDLGLDGALAWTSRYRAATAP